MKNTILNCPIGKRFSAWLVYRLCDLHTLLSLAQFQVEDWLQTLDPTTPVPARGCRAYGKAYTYDGKQVHEQVLKFRVIHADEVRFKQRRAEKAAKENAS